jgi:spore maturation protein SpmA
MLNYIWAGLIVSSFLFAIGYDIRDLQTDRFRNGEPLAVVLAFPNGYDSTARQVPVTIRIEPATYGAFYRTDERPDSVYTGSLLQTREGRQLRFDAASRLPEPLATIGKVSASRDKELQGRFPEVPRDHPALAMIALALTANVFGLGNAATPFGIKAMEELQKLNKSDDTATNPMVMMLALSTSSVQLVPPVLLLALLGLQINRLVFPIIVTGLLGLIIAIVSAKLLGRLPAYRDSDPNR